jgi:hypothetical protein
MEHEITILNMPGCNHKVHVSCALTAAQYDVRCPVCRTQHESIEVRGEPDRQLFNQIEDYAVRQEENVRRYKRRRATAIRTNKSLKKLNDNLRIAQRLFTQSDIDLDRVWVRQQRYMWANDVTIQMMKKKRRLYQQRVASNRRRLNARLEPLIGDIPELISVLNM